MHDSRMRSAITAFRIIFIPSPPHHYSPYYHYYYYFFPRKTPIQIILFVLLFPSHASPLHFTFSSYPMRSFRRSAPLAPFPSSSSSSQASMVVWDVAVDDGAHSPPGDRLTFRIRTIELPSRLRRALSAEGEMPYRPSATVH